MYEKADAVIREMNRKNLRSFGRLKQLRFDELNILTAVTRIYDDSIKLAKKRYYQVALDAYIAAQMLSGRSKRKAELEAEDAITKDWVLDMLEDYDVVTLYQFLPEADRKKQRLVEALIASHKRNAEVDKALRYWTLQLSQYAIKSVDEATLQAYKDAGVQYVKWNTQEDERVCGVCNPRDERIYPIEKAPPKAHYSCRCYYTPVMKRG